MVVPLLLALTPPNVTVLPGSVQKISQITGETDRQRNVPTDNQTETRFGLRGTDLGASFEHRGRLVFLFGDTHPSQGNTPDRPFDGDSVAFSDDRNPEDGLTLDFVRADDGKYLAVKAPGVSLKGFEVPNGGFSDGKAMYAYFTTDARFTPGVVMGRSVLLRSLDGKKWDALYTVSTGKFINVSPWVVDAERVPGLPIRKGQGVLLWAGSREYRRSSPYLAFLPLDQVGNRSAMRYWAGDGKWSTLESAAVPLVDHREVGELSVAWCEPLKCWLMLYNSVNPRGILMRTAEQPWGPWSEAKMLFEPRKDGGYGKFMHIDWRDEKVDSVHDAGRENEYGGEYGPYMIPRFFRGDSKEATIYFVMSTWNPYQVMLMRAKLARD